MDFLCKLAGDFSQYAAECRIEGLMNIERLMFILKVMRAMEKPVWMMAVAAVLMFLS